MLTKSQQLLLYLIELKGGHIDDKTKLAKYQYFTDFIHYAFNGSPVSQETTTIYKKQKQGPLSFSFTDDLETLKKLGFIKEDPKFHFKIIKEDYKFNLTESDKKTARFVIEKYGKLSFQELVNISHCQEPYLSAEKGAVIQYFTAFNLVDSYPDYEQFSN